MNDQKVPLDLLDRATIRKRSRNVGIASLLVGAALGGIVGIFGGPTGFFVTAAIVAVPLLVLAYSESRKTYWLQGSRVSARAFGTRTVDLHGATNLDVLVTDVRGSRTVSLLVSGPPKGKTLSLALASYAGTGGRELGIYALRRLADALAGADDTRALVLSELIVAQLKAEARGDAPAERPLYRLASLAPQGHLAQKLLSRDVARFVATLD